MTEQGINCVRFLNNEIAKLEKQIKNLRDSATDLVPVRDDMPRSQEVKSRVEKLALKIVELDRRLAELKTQLVLSKTTLIEKITSTVSDPTLQKFLLLRYVDCLPYKEIAHRMRFTLRYIYYLNEKFLKAFTLSSP